MQFSKFIKAGVALSSLSVGGTYLAFNSVYIDYYKNAVHLYERGTRKMLSERLEKLCNEILNEIKLPTELKKKCNFFHSAGFDVYSIGSLHLGQLAYIGLPDHFQYTSIDETEFLSVFKQPVKLYSTSGRKLRESLVLSEDAKKFAIARDIYFCDSYRIHFKSLILSTSVLLPHLLYYAINRRLSTKPRGVKIFTYSLFVSISYIFYCLSVDILNQHYEKIADRRAILLETGNYFEGALEYYGKMLQRNKALRKMMGEQGSKYFTREGNDVVYFRRIHLPLTTRIAEIEEFKNPYSSRE